MNYYALFYSLVDNYINRRAEFREEHLKLANESNTKGDLIIAGAFNDPADRALLVFRADDKSVIEEFIRIDPYYKNGLVTSYEIREWKVVIGKNQ